MADSLEYVFEPYTIKLNGEDFVVELRPTCERRYCEDQCGDSDGFPTWDNFLNRQCSQMHPDDAEERVVQYVSWERTILVALTVSNFAEVPARIKVDNIALGSHGGAVLVGTGGAVKYCKVRIYETTPEDKLAIEKEREALAVVAAEREALARQHAVDVVESDSEANAASSPASDTVAASDAIRGEEEGEAEAPQRAGGTDDQAQANGAADAGKIEQNPWIFGDLTIEKRGDEPYVKFGNGEFVALEGQCRKIVNSMLVLGATSEENAKSAKDILAAASIKSDIRLQTPFTAAGKDKKIRRGLWENYLPRVGRGGKSDPYKFFLGQKPKSTAAATPGTRAGSAGSTKVRRAPARALRARATAGARCEA